MENTKKCKRCEEVKLLDCFYDNKQNKDGKDSYCRPCRYAHGRDRKDIVNARRRERMTTDPEHRAKVLEEKQRSYRGNMEVAILCRAKNRAAVRGYDFNLTIGDIIIPEMCPILEVPIVVGKKGDYLFAPSLDRVDNTKGYVKGNVRVISMLANSMKNTADNELLLRFCKNIPTYIQQDDDIVHG